MPLPALDSRPFPDFREIFYRVGLRAGSKDWREYERGNMILRGKLRRGEITAREYGVGVKELMKFVGV